MLKGDVHIRFPEGFLHGLRSGMFEASLKTVSHHNISRGDTHMSLSACFTTDDRGNQYMCALYGTDCCSWRSLRSFRRNDSHRALEDGRLYEKDHRISNSGNGQGYLCSYISSTSHNYSITLEGRTGQERPSSPIYDWTCEDVSRGSRSASKARNREYWGARFDRQVDSQGPRRPQCRCARRRTIVLLGIQCYLEGESGAHLWHSGCDWTETAR